MLTRRTIFRFQRTINAYYQKYKRDFPWRNTTDPYHILVSEVMLQQTQTHRVEPKYRLFIQEFPTIKHLAKTPLSAILRIWQGLGYNRRALFLKQTAEKIMHEYDGAIPKQVEQLIKLPGIGPGTAGAIITYAFGKPIAFIETNIRAAYLYFFFSNETHVTDTAILPLIRDTIDKKNPRDWYYALTDYGAMLKKEKRFRNTQSSQYTKQKKFQGSNRQIRGAIIRLLTDSSLSLTEVQKKLNINKITVLPILSRLQNEGLIERKGSYYGIVS